MKRFQIPARWAFAIAAVFACAGCSSQPTYDFTPRQRPTIVLVYDFHASPTTPFEDPRLIAEGTKDFGTASPEARQAAIGELIRTGIRAKLIDGINVMGMTAQAGDPSTPAPAGALLVRGEFCTGSPDNRLVRNLVQFDKDQSSVDTDVYAIGAVTQDNLRPLLHLLTNAESKAMRAAKERGETSATLATYRPQIDQLVDETTNQTLAGLSVYLANQGWISRDQIRSALVAQR